MINILILVSWMFCFRGFIRGPGLDARPLSLAFHDKLKQGALLSVVIDEHSVFIYVHISFKFHEYVIAFQCIIVTSILLA